MTAPAHSAVRRLDAAAVDCATRRMARAPQAPWLHAEVARRMAQRLEVIRLRPQVILDWWGFLGAGAEPLDRAYPQARRIVIEPNAALVERSLSAARRPWWSASHWGAKRVGVLADTGELPAGVQLVWANMMLHAVVDPPALFERWERVLGAEGFVMFSCLGPGTLRELRALYARLGWATPAADFVDMHDLGDMLVQAGFADPVMDQETLTLRWDSAPALLAELHALGGNTAPARMPGLRTPRWRARLLHELDALAGADGKLGLSFEIAYGHAFKAAPRLRQGESTTVTLEAMRSMVRSGRPRG